MSLESRKNVIEKSRTARRAVYAFLNAVSQDVGPVGKEFHLTCNEFLLLCKRVEIVTEYDAEILGIEEDEVQQA